MQVQDVVDLGDGHLIEFGPSTWNPNVISVRNRYPTSDGRFSPHSSSEIPLDDLEKIIIEVVKRDLINVKVTTEIISVMANSILRRL